MKSFLLSTMLLISGLLHAEDMKIFEIDNNTDKVVSSEFAINKELDRAWVEITVSERFGDPDDMHTKSYRQKVEGLRYDSASGNIVLDKDGQIIECAAVKTRGISFLKHDNIENSNCSFLSQNLKVGIDDGFVIKKQKQTHVFLHIN